MENFNTDLSSHPSNYLKRDDPFYPCQNQKTLYKGACYFYAPDYYLTLHAADFSGALKWCNTAEKDFRLTCANGVGSRTMKRNILNPLFVERICDGGVSDDQIKYCIDGMVSYYMVHYSSVAKGQELCSQLSEVNNKVCKTSVDSRKNLFL